jgi:hypothetical protein
VVCGHGFQSELRYLFVCISTSSGFTLLFIDAIVTFSKTAD